MDAGRKNPTMTASGVVLQSLREEMQGSDCHIRFQVHPAMAVNDGFIARMFILLWIEIREVTIIYCQTVLFEP